LEVRILADARRAIPLPFLIVGIVGVRFFKIKPAFVQINASSQANGTPHESCQFHNFSLSRRAAAQIGVFIDKNAMDQ
jgi:hypothetical protein